jgi:hypothetical protein
VWCASKARIFEMSGALSFASSRYLADWWRFHFSARVLMFRKPAHRPHGTSHHLLARETIHLRKAVAVID